MDYLGWGSGWDVRRQLRPAGLQCVVFAGHVILHHEVLWDTQNAQQDSGGESRTILPRAAVPGYRRTTGNQNGMNILAKLRGKRGGKLPIGL